MAEHDGKGKIVGYAYCLKCGLVHLKNEATRKELKKPCPGSDK